MEVDHADDVRSEQHSSQLSLADEDESFLRDASSSIVGELK